MKEENRQLVSMAFLLVALFLFVGYHVSPGFGREEEGWHLWVRLWQLPQNLRHLRSLDAVAIASFLNFSVLIVASPFLRNVWPKSLWAWWGAVIFSGLATAGFWTMFMLTAAAAEKWEGWGIGGWCLMTAPIFNFAGLLLARSTLERPQLPGV